MAHRRPKLLTTSGVIVIGAGYQRKPSPRDDLQSFLPSFGKLRVLAISLIAAQGYEQRCFYLRKKLHVIVLVAWAVFIEIGTGGKYIEGQDSIAKGY